MKNYVPLLFLMFFIQIQSNAQLVVDLESGAVFNGSYNNIRIPGNNATKFNAFGSDFDTDPTWFYRLRVGYTFNSKHTITALYAPLTVYSNANSSANSPILFEGQTFVRADGLKVKYMFNSYRLTYRYHFVNNDTWNIGIGLTAKIRDAGIGLTDNNSTAEKTNLGVVPLINFYAKYNPTTKLGILIEGDGLVTPFTPGRAFDVFGGLTYKVFSNTEVKGGYRILEGGADTDEVYNFTLIHYASLGLVFTFGEKK